MAGGGPAGSTRVLVVGEHAIFCEALGVAVALQDDLEFAGAAASADEAVDIVARESPDVAVIDVDLSKPEDGTLGGIELIRRLKETCPELRVLVLSASLEIDTMAKAASAGACGFLAKKSSVVEICEAIRTAKDGGMFVERELVPSLVKRLKVSARGPIGGGSARADITPREQEVLSLLGEGLDVTVIARRLDISVSTARGHVKNLLMKLGSHSQLEAVVEAAHQGLLPHLTN